MGGGGGGRETSRLHLQRKSSLTPVLLQFLATMRTITRRTAHCGPILQPNTSQLGRLQRCLPGFRFFGRLNVVPKCALPSRFCCESRLTKCLCPF